MADNLTKRVQPDRSKINMHEDFEVKHWTHALGVSREELQTWLHMPRSRRARWASAWAGLVLIAGGLLFLTIRWGEGAREAAASKTAIDAVSATTPKQ